MAFLPPLPNFLGTPDSLYASESCFLFTTPWLVPSKLLLRKLQLECNSIQKLLHVTAISYVNPYFFMQNSEGTEKKVNSR